MWADAKCDDRPAEYWWRPLQKFRNSIFVEPSFILRTINGMHQTGPKRGQYHRATLKPWFHVKIKLF